MVRYLAVLVLIFGFGIAQQKTNFDNCREMNKVYPNGVGKVGATDNTSTGRPVTTFIRNTALYNAIIRNNANLDRDDDGIACERR